MTVPKEIQGIWEELRSPQDSKTLQQKLAEKGHEYTTESVRNWLSPNKEGRLQMPDFAFDLFSEFYKEKAKKVNQRITEFKNLMGR